MSTSWTEKTTAVVAIVTLLIGAGGIIATVALYQGRIEEKVAQVDKRLERMEDKIDKIAPPTVRVGDADVKCDTKDGGTTVARREP